MRLSLQQGLAQMSYYGPDFADIKTGWYRNTSDENYAAGRRILDKNWNTVCDEILTVYLERYGTFFTAFSEDIVRDIDTALGTSFEKNARYYEYYLATRAYEIEKTRRIWIDSYNDNQDRIYICPYCENAFPVLDCHPNVIRTLGIPPTHCRTCDYVVRRYRDFWDSDVKRRVRDMMRSIDELRSCEICGHTYFLKDDIFTYGSFGKRFVDCLYPNLFFNVCPKCFKGVFNDYKRGSARTKLSRLYASPDVSVGSG